jgi:hypothetical protein
MRTKPKIYIVTMLSALTGLLSGHTWANDRDLRATPIPAASCELKDTVQQTVWHHSLGAWSIFGIPNEGNPPLFGIRVYCGLQVNSIEKSSRTSNDNDISKISIVYKDSDVLGPLNFVQVTLKKISLLTSSEDFVSNIEVCKWNSNINGNGSTAYTKATFDCAHDVALNSFYYFGSPYGNA